MKACSPLLAALVAGLLGTPAWAADTRPCAVPVRYAAEWFPSPELDHGKPAAQVTALGASAKGSGTQLGHVSVQTELSLQPQDGCAGVVVRLRFLKPVLRVASELPAGSCAYARVLNHEHTHVRLYREVAERFRRLHYPWPDGAKPAALLAHAKQELAALLRVQDEFDSPEEYARNTEVCGGEIARLVKPASRPGSRPAAAMKRG